MKTRSEILQELRASLNSAAWMQLKNSMLGKELLSLGAEIIYRNSLVKESFTAGFDYSTCDYSDLITLARRNNCAVSNNEPSYVKAYASSLISPFQESKTMGGVTFKNIDYFKAGDLATYYEGQSVELYSTTSMGVLTTDSSRQLDTSKMYVNINGIAYIRLSTTAMPDSVHFYAQGENNAIIQVPIYDHSLYSDIKQDGTYTNGDFIKLITLEDGCIAIQLPTTFNYSVWSCYFLELAHADFEVSGDTGIVEAYIGTENNIEYARSLYAQSLYQYNVIHTISDIHDYVKSCEGVLDCKVFTDADLRKVAIYIKPKVKGSSIPETFANIKYKLKLHGDLFSDYSVMPGVSLEFSFMIAAEERRNEIEALVKSTYSYDNMNFDTPVVASDVRSLIFDELGIKAEVHLNISEAMPPTSEFTLNLLPENGSLFFKSGTTINAWDQDGVLYAKGNATAFTISDFSGRFGNSLIILDNTGHKQYVVDAITYQKVDITTVLDNLTNHATLSNAVTWYSSSTNPIFECNGVTYILHNTPFWHNPSGCVPSAAVAWSTTQSFSCSTSGLVQNALVYGKVLYTLNVASGIVSLYRTAPSTTYTPYPIGQISGNINTTILKNGNMYIFTDSGNVYRVGIANGFTSMVTLTNKFAGYTTGSIDIVADGMNVSYVTGGKAYIATDIIDGGANVSTTTTELLNGTSSVTGKPLCIYNGDTAFANVSTITIYHNGEWSSNSLESYGTPQAVGVVSYITGEVSLSGSVTADTISYKSQSSKLTDSNTYFVLSDNPVVWR